MGIIFSIFSSFFLGHFILLFLSSFAPVANLTYPFQHIVEQFAPRFLTPLGAFDGAHYIMIARQGYGQFQQAFFPLYPLLINALSKLFASNFLLSGLVISWATLFFGIFFFVRLSKLILGNRQRSIWAILFLLSFPSAFFYLTVYPESLFLFLSSASLYFIFRKNYPVASIFAVLSSLTKIQGIFLVIPFLLVALDFRKMTFKEMLEQIISSFPKILFIFSPIYGLLIYGAYLFITYGDPFYFYHSQEAFGANRSSQNIIFLPQVIFRYIKIFTTAQINFQYWIAVSEFFIFLIVFGVLILELFRVIKSKRIEINEMSINLYSIFILILPTLTGTLSSIPRYALVSYGFFLALAKIKNNIFKILIAAIFAFFHIILFFYFIKGYFVS